MTEEQQRIKIAEACGWKREFDGNHEEPEWYWIPPNNPDGDGELPDYLNDLNAMHEAEKSLSNLSFYRSFLYLVVLDDPTNKSNEPAWATAAQRAEAFLRTIGKWTNNQPTEP